MNAEGGLGGSKEPKGAREQQEGPIKRAQDPPAVPTIQVGNKGEAEAGLGVGWGAWPAPLLQGAPPTSACTRSLHPPNVSMNWCQYKWVQHVQAPHLQRDSEMQNRTGFPAERPGSFIST